MYDDKFEFNEEEYRVEYMAEDRDDDIIICNSMDFHGGVFFFGNIIEIDKSGSQVGNPRDQMPSGDPNDDLLGMVKFTVPMSSVVCIEKLNMETFEMTEAEMESYIDSDGLYIKNT